MTYKFSVSQVYYNNKILVGTYETKQIALQVASEINASGNKLSYVSELKVYGGKPNEHTKR